MSYSKKMIERCIRRALEGKSNGKKHKGGKAASGGIARSRSFLSMDNLDIKEEENEDETSSSKSQNNEPSSDESDELRMKKFRNSAQVNKEVDDSMRVGAKTTRENYESPMNPSEDQNRTINSNKPLPITVE